MSVSQVRDELLTLIAIGQAESDWPGVSTWGLEENQIAVRMSTPGGAEWFAVTVTRMLRPTGGRADPDPPDPPYLMDPSRMLVRPADESQRPGPSV